MYLDRLDVLKVLAPLVTLFWQTGQRGGWRLQNWTTDGDSRTGPDGDSRTGPLGCKKGEKCLLVHPRMCKNSLKRRKCPDMGKCREGFHVSGTSKMNKEQKEAEKKKTENKKEENNKNQSKDKRSEDLNGKESQPKSAENNDFNTAAIQSFLGGLVRREVINLLQPMLETGPGSVLTTPAGPSQPTHQQMAQIWPTLPSKITLIDPIVAPNPQLPMPIPQATVNLLRLLLQPQGSQ